MNSIELSTKILAQLQNAEATFAPPELDEKAKRNTGRIMQAERQTEGVAIGEICVIVFGTRQTERAAAAVSLAGIEAIVIDSQTEPDPSKASIATMHEAKGLEFRAVVVMDCDDEVLPLQSRIESATDTSELEEVYNTERHLLYVACTRARDHLLVTAVDPASEFLDDFDGAAGK
ncbi:MAG: 3'-5' exonuclease [Rubripirellula sp.]